ncbi:major facilitator superfamily domain-containing protein [Zychaea mexicana]|uniref:major facilitator superfamily domain-containing protein n=1 Tax=Zychaea mexicana TaxID=64656 RepID=UPI0022FE6074|nr:major facilitator superfamily domain-containing protein [Zychaea mexicana]KAI9479564.1 major facilitator superfamily domain-containing protein [Zychaea mexicana]
MFICVVGSHFAAHTLGAMKSTVKEEFGITNSQYGVLQSSVSIVNTILPVIGGIFLDAFGTSTGSILTTVLITVGNILVAASTHNASLSTMIVGRIMYGIGSGTVVIVQETILSQWFKGRNLAGVVALMMTTSRLASFLAQATVVPIANFTGWYGYGFWFSAILCVFSLVINLVYIMLMRSIISGTCQQGAQALRRKKTFSWSKLLYLPHAYWLIAIMEFLLGGAWGCFLHINSEFVKLKFGYDNAKAAATASVAQLLPIFLMPLLGICVDRFGKRTWMMLASGITFLACFMLLGFTYLNPIIGMLLFSVSLALGPVGLVSSVPVILPLSLVGTGMGLIKSGTNIGASLFDIATGLLQDKDAHQGYSGVIDFFIIIGIFAVFAGLVLCVLDWTIYGSLLDRSAQEARRLEATENKVDTSAVQEKLWANWIYGGIYLGLAALSWVLFFKFVLVY